MVSTDVTLAEAAAAAAAAPPGVTGAVATAISARLSQLAGLSLPASMHGQAAAAAALSGSSAAAAAQQQRPTAAQIEDYLHKLIVRDVAVFLERHGKLLTDEELASFQALRCATGGQAARQRGGGAGARVCPPPPLPAARAH
jgi:hypothetical protein